MQPNFTDGEYLIVDEISYRLREPHRGEVVIFRFPKDPSQFYIKRIIGLPGETVTINDDKIIIKNKQDPDGFLLNEDAYLPMDDFSLGQIEATLTDGEYFVLGDNRDQSFDSRRWGPLPRKMIIGRALFRAWPIERAQAIEVPLY